MVLQIPFTIEKIKLFLFIVLLFIDKFSKNHTQNPFYKHQVQPSKLFIKDLNPKK